MSGYRRRAALQRKLRDFSAKLRVAEREEST
jgi:hypothetical protein